MDKSVSSYKRGCFSIHRDEFTTALMISYNLKWCILTYGPLTETRKSELVLFYICYKTGIMGVCQCKQLVFGNKINDKSKNRQMAE